jgi:hypothetical protein
LAVWVIATALGLIGRPSVPRLFGIGAQHAAEFQFTPEAQHQLEQAQAQMDSTNRSYNALRWISDIASWSSFLATSLIALITGGFNLPVPSPAGRSDTPPTQPEGARPQPHRFQILGFLAAIASVCTLLAAQVGTSAAARLACSKELRDRITEVAQALKDSPQNEFATLNRLRDATSRRCD